MTVYVVLKNLHGRTTIFDVFGSLESAKEAVRERCWRNVEESNNGLTLKSGLARYDIWGQTVR